jgi:ribose transport system permease protein
MTADANPINRPIAAALHSLRTVGVVFAALILLIAVTIANPSFLAYANLTNVLSQWAPVGIMAIGMTYVVITGGFDLSVGAVYTLCSVTAAALGRTEAPVVAFAAATVVGLLAGCLNGWLVAGLRVTPFIATLGSSLVFTGITLVATGNIPFVVTYAPFATVGSGRLGGFPYSGMLLLALMLLGGGVLAFTTYGQRIYAVGGNAEASWLAGIRTAWTTASAYVIAGGCAGVGGVIAASQLSSAQPSASPNLVFDVLTVVVVGGTSLAGGLGAMWRTAVGLVILATLQNGFNLLNINPYYQDIVKGLIIIGALSLDRVPWARVSAPSAPRPDTAVVAQPSMNGPVTR